MSSGEAGVGESGNAGGVSGSDSGMVGSSAEIPCGAVGGESDDCLARYDGVVGVGVVMGDGGVRDGSVVRLGGGERSSSSL
jgi:hypothetical protein